MTGKVSASVVFVLVAGVATGGGAVDLGDAIFSSAFELGPALCDWSALVTPCIDRDGVVATLDGTESVPFCLRGVTGGGISYCQTTTCDGAPGCPATLHVIAGSAVMDPGDHLRYEVAVSLDDLDAPMEYPFGACTIQSSGYEAEIFLRFPLACTFESPPVSPMPVAAVALQEVSTLAGTYSLAGGWWCQSSPPPDWQDAWRHYLESEVSHAMQNRLGNDFVGRFLCASEL